LTHKKAEARKVTEWGEKLNTKITKGKLLDTEKDGSKEYTEEKFLTRKRAEARKSLKGMSWTDIFPCHSALPWGFAPPCQKSLLFLRSSAS
jgi:hypothetical protein